MEREAADGLDLIGDICALPRLDIEAVVNILRTRLERNKMYTRAGPVLIALNPYKHVSWSRPVASPHLRLSSPQVEGFLAG